MTRTVAALYDTRSEAEFARSLLISELRAKSPRIIGKDTAGAVDGLKIARSDADAYREGLRRGCHLVVAEVPSGAAPKRIIELLEQSTGAPREDASGQQWGDGEQGVEVRLSSEAKEAVPTQQSVPDPPAEGGASEARTVPEGAARVAGAAEAVERTTPAEEQPAPLAEEELRIGKRQVVGDSARVRSVVHETPAEEVVQLREEVIDVESRPCERHVTESDIEAAGLFKERTFEFAAMREEPVVTKTAVVREEVIVSKRVKHRTETVRDSVRRTAIEIEDPVERRESHAVLGADS